MLVTLIYGSDGGSQRVAGAHAAHHAPILGAALGAEEDILQDVAHYSEQEKLAMNGAIYTRHSQQIRPVCAWPQLLEI